MPTNLDPNTYIKAYNLFNAQIDLLDSLIGKLKGQLSIRPPVEESAIEASLIELNEKRFFLRERRLVLTLETLIAAPSQPLIDRVAALTAAVSSDNLRQASITALVNLANSVLTTSTELASFVAAPGPAAISLPAKLSATAANSAAVVSSEGIKTRSNKYYGWMPDMPDHRDLLFSARAPIPKKLPKRVDLSSKCSQVENQGNLGSCTANALVGAMEYLYIKEAREVKDLSRLFLYYNERVMIDTVGEDSGAYLRDGIKSLNKQGVCTEDSWPYDISQFMVKPAAACYQEAEGIQILAYFSIRSLDEARACIAEGFPFAFGFTVYTAFEADSVKKSGVVNYPEATEKQLGGHAVLAVGYDDATKRFIVRNSWGPDWGKNGYFTMPYDYLFGGKRPALASDFWTIRRVE